MFDKACLVPLALGPAALEKVLHRFEHNPNQHADRGQKDSVAKDRALVVAGAGHMGVHILGSPSKNGGERPSVVAEGAGVEERGVEVQQRHVHCRFLELVVEDIEAADIVLVLPGQQDVTHAHLVFGKCVDYISQLVAALVDGAVEQVAQRSIPLRERNRLGLRKRPPGAVTDTPGKILILGACSRVEALVGRLNAPDCFQCGGEDRAGGVARVDRQDVVAAAVVHSHQPGVCLHCENHVRERQRLVEPVEEEQVAAS
mmetsp:Transcript_6677/g.15363  ORF Transcript_6677/g.15363 Transcript_6677/m.15363 type:complete len:258 (-) Transcript_6677:1401-2174(-)